MMEAQVGLGFSAGSVAETLRMIERLTRRAELVSGLKRRLERLQLTADGVVLWTPHASPHARQCLALRGLRTVSVA